MAAVDHVQGGRSQKRLRCGTPNIPQPPRHATLSGEVAPRSPGRHLPCSIFFGKQDASRGAVGFREDPYSLAGAPDCVAADNPETVLHGEVVLLRIYGRHDAPIAVLVPGQERGGVLAGTREEGEWLGLYPEIRPHRDGEGPAAT